MCRIAHLPLHPEPAAAGRAREFVDDQLSRWGLGDCRDEALLVVSELVTNATIHAGTPITLTLAVAESVIELAVGDYSPRAPRAGAAAEQLDRPAPGDGRLRDGGRGIPIVDAMSRGWGVNTDGNGKQVWARLGVPQSWPHATGCPCHGSGLHATTLASGVRARHVPGDWDRAT
jgi:anti-sigma regulatory factor (Ser/Thr protein kinase)